MELISSTFWSCGGEMNSIRSIIKEKGVTNIRISKLLGIGKTSLYRRLNGQVKFKKKELQEISDFLNVPIEKLIAEDKSND